MKFRLENWTAQRIEAQKRVAMESLKCCPLCDAVNAIQNGECFVCRWHGEFLHDADLIEQGVAELLDRCPELVDVMLEEEPVRPKPWERITSLVGRLFRRRRYESLDFRI